MRSIVKLLSLIIVLALVGSPFATPVSAAVWQSKVDPWVLDTATTKGQTEFLVYLTQQADLSGTAALKTKVEKGTYVFQQLTEVAERTQPAVIAALEAQGVNYRPYWIANMIWVQGNLDNIRTLALRADVGHLYANPSVKMDAPDIQAPLSDAAPEAIEWNITKTNAPQVWAAEFTGQGAVIGGQDTGYQWDHPALKNHYRGWNGVTANHNYQWHDAIHSGDGGVCGLNSLFPCDDYGHGTHTMGTMVGDDGGANQIGMAPGAKWIGCRNMDVGTGTPTTYSECYQWFIAPTDLNNLNPRPDLAPDVINNSWGCPASEGCTDPTVLLSVVQAVTAAGIVTAHSAGNSGSSCGSIDTPGAIYEESFTVGATDSSDNIAGFSSRGPSTYSGNTYLKPNVSAPGVNIRSSVPGNSYQGGWDGTSMAGPHVAGLVALLISAEPALAGQVDMIENVIEHTTLTRTSTQACGGVPGTQIPNNTYGWGRIDAWKAYLRLAHTLTITKTASATEIAPGGILTYTLTVSHTNIVTATTNVVISDVLPAGVELITATQPFTQSGGTILWHLPTLPANTEAQVELVVQVPVTATGTIVNSDYGVRSDDVALVVGTPVSTTVVPNTLEISKAGAAEVASGSLLTYTLTITNPLPEGPKNHLVITDTLPAHTVFVSATGPYTVTGNTVEWDLLSLATGGVYSTNLVVQIPLTATGSILNADYGVRSDETPTVKGSPVSTTVLPFGLELLKTGPFQVAQGGFLTYTLTITNLHPFAATHDLVLTDTLPVSTTFVSATGSYTLTNGVVQWEASSLASGATLQVQLVLQADPALIGVVSNADYGAVSAEVLTPARGDPVMTIVQDHLLTLYLPIVIKR